MNLRGFWAGASVLVSLALGAVVLSFLLDRPHPSEKQRAAAKSTKREPAQKIPETRNAAQPFVQALRLPPPPAPPAPAKPKTQRVAVAPAPPPPPVVSTKAPPKPALAKTLPKPVPLEPPKPKPVPKPAEVKRPVPAPPPLIARKVEAPPPPQPRTRGEPKPARRTLEPPRPRRIARSRPQPRASAQPVVPTRATRREGRTLLRLLEYGKGPQIEIAWPDAATTRDGLYRRFRDCFGMRNAVITPGGQLFGETGPSGAPLALNLDRYSGFVRRPAGRAIPAERAQARAIAERHGVAGRLVRIFPRSVDAIILGGLNHVIGPAYRDARTITARYSRRDGRLVLDGIRVNGRPFKGAVDVGAIGPRGCRA